MPLLSMLPGLKNSVLGEEHIYPGSNKDDENKIECL